MKKLLIKLLARPIKMFNKMKIKRFYKKANINPKEIKVINKSLVLIPHVDDEVIGLEGLMSGLSEENEIHLLYGTDSGGSLSDKERIQISNERFNEADKIAKDLNVNIIGKITEIKNGELDWSFDIFNKCLINILNNNNYDSIFTVSPIDAHPDHRKLTYFLAKTLKAYDYSGDIYLYEVSNLLPNNWINAYYNMSLKVYEDKTQLYKHFASQKTMDFDIFNKLNKYKGLAINTKQPVEYFSKMSKKKFIEKIDMVEEEDMSKIIPRRIGNNISFYKVINREDLVQKIYIEKDW